MIDFETYIEKVQQNYGQECVDNLLRSDFDENALRSNVSELSDDDNFFGKAASGIGSFIMSAMEQAKKESENKQRERQLNMRKLDRTMTSFDNDFDRIENDFDNEWKQLDDEFKRMDN